MRNISVRAAMARGAGFFGFWLLLIGPDPADLAAGFFAAAAATWTSLRLLPPSGGRLRYAALARLALRFGQESIMGGLDVARRALILDYRCDRGSSSIRYASPRPGLQYVQRTDERVAGHAAGRRRRPRRAPLSLP